MNIKTRMNKKKKKKKNMEKNVYLKQNNTEQFCGKEKIAPMGMSFSVSCLVNDNLQYLSSS